MSVSTAPQGAHAQSPAAKGQQPQGAHLVGSINLPDADSAFRAASAHLGAHLKRLPDGEPGERFHWIAFQPNRLDSTIGLERVGEQPILLRDMLDVRQLRISDGFSAEQLELPNLGYADAAIDSWEVFQDLRAQGVIAPDIKFQVALPTPLATVASFIFAADRAAFEPVYTAALNLELDRILTAIPHESLSIQWDCAVEFGFIESAQAYARGAFDAWWDDVFEGVVERAARQAARVPDSVEVGFHLCYGDSGEKHFIEPTDTANLVRFANALFAASPHKISYLHLPVPIERDDSAYFEPLSGLSIPSDTELYLGVVHREDGQEGASRRIAAALPHAPVFGVAAECGCGRAPEQETTGLLETHAAVAAAW